jgi:hypothetical protein
MKYTKYCPYCTPTPDNRLLNEGTYDLSHIDIKIVGKGRVLRVRSYNLSVDVDNETYERQECVLIQYCPICGRDLVGVEANIYNEQFERMQKDD